MEQRVTLITLGVADVETSTAFYRRLGWHVGLDVEETVFFQAGDLVVTLWGRDKLAADSGVDDGGGWGRDKLAADSGVDDGGGWGGVTLAHNVRSRDLVDAVIEEARAAGARIAREPAETFYGGYAGVFVDPDGHRWEIAFNPGFELTDSGAIRLPPS